MSVVHGRAFSEASSAQQQTVRLLKCDHDSIKEVFPETFPMSRLSLVVAVVTGTPPGVTALHAGGRGGLPHRRCKFLGRPLDDLVELAPAKPHPAALRAIVDFDTLAFRHGELYIFAHWTLHDV